MKSVDKMLYEYENNPSNFMYLSEKKRNARLSDMQKLSQQYALLESKYQMANNEVNASGEDMEA